MKKLLCLLLLLVFTTFADLSFIADSDYQNFQEIEVFDGKLLSQFTKDEYSEYYKNIKKRRFNGWNIHKVNENIHVSYKTETLFSYYNDGKTSIDYEYEYEKKKSSNINITSTGSISVSASGTIKKFKGGLDTSLKITYEDKSSLNEKEAWKIKMHVDPGTQANLYTYGEGKISNGVASRYFFWILLDKGGYEVFSVTTQYYRLEKVSI